MRGVALVDDRFVDLVKDLHYVAIREGLDCGDTSYVGKSLVVSSRGGGGEGGGEGGDVVGGEQ